VEMTRKKLKLKKSNLLNKELKKSMTLNERELKIIILGLRFAMVQEIEWQGAYAHMKDQKAKDLVKESEKLVLKFKKLGKKIQNVLRGETL
jgi:hypothetical protein